MTFKAPFQHKRVYDSVICQTHLWPLLSCSWRWGVRMGHVSADLMTGTSHNQEDFHCEHPRGQTRIFCAQRWELHTKAKRPKFPWSANLTSRHYIIDTETVSLAWFEVVFPEYLQPCCVQDALLLPPVCNTVRTHIFLPGNKYLFSRWLMRSLGSERWQRKAQMWRCLALQKCEEY